jgi:hypothetical protein
MRSWIFPQEGIDSNRSKLVFKIFDECTNISKGMYSVRFNGCLTDIVTSPQDNSVPCGQWTHDPPHPTSYFLPSVTV